MQKNKRLVEIVNTLQQIEKANKMLAFHLRFEQPDRNAIENFQRLKYSFLHHLAVLLEEYEGQVKLTVAA